MTCSKMTRLPWESHLTSASREVSTRTDGNAPTERGQQAQRGVQKLKLRKLRGGSWKSLRGQTEVKDVRRATGFLSPPTAIGMRVSGTRTMPTAEVNICMRMAALMMVSGSAMKSLAQA